MTQTDSISSICQLPPLASTSVGLTRATATPASSKSTAGSFDRSAWRARVSISSSMTRLAGGILCAAEFTSLLIRKRRLGDGAPGVGGAFQQRAPVSIGIVGRRLETRAPGVQLARGFLIGPELRVHGQCPFQRTLVIAMAEVDDVVANTASAGAEGPVERIRITGLRRRCDAVQEGEQISRHRDNPTHSPADPCRTSMSSRRHRWWRCARSRVDSATRDGAGVTTSWSLQSGRSPARQYQAPSTATIATMAARTLGARGMQRAVSRNACALRSVHQPEQQAGGEEKQGCERCRKIRKRT